MKVSKFKDLFSKIQQHVNHIDKVDDTLNSLIQKIKSSYERLNFEEKKQIQKTTLYQNNKAEIIVMDLGFPLSYVFCNCTLGGEVFFPKLSSVVFKGCIVKSDLVFKKLFVNALEFETTDFKEYSLVISNSNVIEVRFEDTNNVNEIKLYSSKFEAIQTPKRLKSISLNYVTILGDFEFNSKYFESLEVMDRSELRNLQLINLDHEFKLKVWNSSISYTNIDLCPYIRSINVKNSKIIHFTLMHSSCRELFFNGVSNLDVRYPVNISVSMSSKVDSFRGWNIGEAEDFKKIEDLYMSEKQPIHLSIYNARSLSVKNSRLNFFNIDKGKITQRFILYNSIIEEMCANSTLMPEFITFSGLKVDRLSLNNAELNGSLAFKNCTLRHVPKFFGTKVNVYLKFEKTSIKTVDAQSTFALRRIKQIMEQLGNEVDKFKFQAYELKSKKKEFSFDGFLALCVDLFCGFGTSTSRPFLLVLLSILVGTILYGSTNNTIINPQIVAKVHALPPSIQEASNHLGWTEFLVKWNSYERGLYFSTINSLGPIKFIASSEPIIAKTVVAQVVSSIQAFISSILWYLGIVGVKRNFGQH